MLQEKQNNSLLELANTVWKKIKDINNVEETDWLVFFLLWNRLRYREQARFRFSERELLGFCGFGGTSLDLTPMRHSASKLIHQNLHLRAPSSGDNW